MSPTTICCRIAIAALLGLAGCEPQRDPSCPAEAAAPAQMPRTSVEHQTLEYWLARVGASHDLDEVLLSPEDAVRLNARHAGRGESGGHRNLLEPVDGDALDRSVREMLGFVRDRLERGRYVDERGEPFGAAELEAVSEARIPSGFESALHVALAATQLRCGPLPRGLFGRTVDLGHDLNACSTAHPQEVVQVLATWPNGMRLARTRYALGWIAADAALSPAIPPSLSDAFVGGARVRAERALDLAKEDGSRLALDKHTLLPVLPTSPRLVMVVSARGFHTAEVAPGLEPIRRPLTRRALLETAFSFLDSPYGYGGLGAGRDCSRLTLDVFESFGIALPRYSGWQAQAGSFALVVDGLEEPDKLQVIDAAARHGAVVLHFQGHIMLYLGRDDHGVPMVLHALGQYREVCDGGEFDTLYTLRRVVVSDLELGRGTRGRSYLERISELAVVGRGPDAELLALVERLAPTAAWHSPGPPAG